jgi:hypothetical protein
MLRLRSSALSLGSTIALGNKTREDPPECKSRKASALGKRWSLRNAEICSVIEPRGLPGNVRLKFRPSTGEVWHSAVTAWTLTADKRIRQPWISP